MLEEVFRDQWGRVLASLVGFLGDFDKAAEQSRTAMDISPTVTGYANLITAYLALDRTDEAKTIYDQAKQHNFDN